MKKYYMKKLRNFILLLILAGTCGLCALLLVFGIPLADIEKHVSDSLPMLEREFGTEEAIEGYPASEIGTFTDCLMLGNAVYDSQEHSLLEQVLYMYRAESGQGDGWAPGESLVDYLTGAEQTKEVEYSRYWHGYLVILKPLLYLMSFNAIRILASYVQIFLVGWIVMLCAQKNEKILGVAFLAAIPFLYFFNLYQSLSLSTCFYLLATFMIIQIKWNKGLEQRKLYGEFFFVAGMATAYFDLLTYPLVTLGFPLCVCLYLNAEKWMDCLKRLIVYSVAWGVGYVGLWAVKWVLTDLLVGGSTISDAVETILSRTDNAVGLSRTSGFWSVILQNAEAYTNWPFLLLTLAIVIGMGLWLFTQRREDSRNGVNCTERDSCKERALCAGGIFLVALFPFVWFFLAQNHSEEHWMFTCKIFAVSVFAFVCAMGKLGKSGTATGNGEEIEKE